jgi:hypothetical protein
MLDISVGYDPRWCALFVPVRRFYIGGGCSSVSGPFLADSCHAKSALILKQLDDIASVA